MKIGVLKERAEFENRVAATPAIIKSFSALGFDVFIESEAGVNAGFTDEMYLQEGAKISKIPLEIIGDADIILKVQPSPKKDSDSTELAFVKNGAIIVGMLNPWENKDLFIEYKNKNISSFSLEFVPRITRAQGMDVLSSQSNLAGYQAVVDAAYEYGSAFPMMMTAAGTITPAKVLILGAGVAGLQAIATARRLGAIVSAFDVRAAAKEQVESLGAKFIEVPNDGQNFETKGGYALEATEEYKRKQSELIAETIQKSDIVISTALIPGKKAPVLITVDMIKTMKPGSVIVDLAAVSGGNCEATTPNSIAAYNGVKVIGYTNYPSRIAKDASSLYAKNVYNFVSLLIDKDTGNLKINTMDEILKASLITNSADIFNELVR